MHHLHLLDEHIAFTSWSRLHIASFRLSNYDEVKHPHAHTQKCFIKKIYVQIQLHPTKISKGFMLKSLHTWKETWTLQHNMPHHTHLLWREGLRSSSKARRSGSCTVITRTIRGVRCCLSRGCSALPTVVWTAAWTGTKRCAGRGIWAQVAVWRWALTLLVQATCTSTVNRRFEIKKSELLVALWHRVVWQTGTHLLHKKLSKGHATMSLSSRGRGHDGNKTSCWQPNIMKLTRKYHLKFSYLVLWPYPMQRFCLQMLNSAVFTS